MKLVWSHIVTEKKINDNIIAKQALQWTLQTAEEEDDSGRLRTTWKPDLEK